MKWLNYHHLLYFWAVAREGSVTAAAAKLHLAQPTVSGQISKLEEALGEQLFERQGRGLVLTEVGRTVYRYADEIFTLGNELMETLSRRPTGGVPRLHAGVVDGMPKEVAAAMLEPVWAGPSGIRLQVAEDRLELLLERLGAHDLDVVLSDAPAPPSAGLKFHSHLLAQSGISFLAAPSIGLGGAFPDCLDGAPLLLPTSDDMLRRSIDTWLHQLDLHPQIVGEFQDSALMKAFGERGHGAFPVVTAGREEVVRQLGVEVVGSTEEIQERFYAITVERRIKHPAVATIVAAARGMGAPLGLTER